MSNYYIGNIYAPLPSSSNYSSWATVSYSLDPADASNVVSTQGHLVKNTIRALNDYISYIEPNNLRSGWGGLYTWRSGEMNVNEGPTADNCAFYVKYKGQWINLRDNTAVEQAGLDDIFELQTVSTTGQRYYVLLRTWGDTDEDKYLFGYTVSIKQNSTLEDFKDSTNKAVIIQFLADINSEDTGEYVDTVAYTTLGGTSPSFEISDAVEEIWETGAATTGELWTATRSIQQYYQGFPLLRTPLTNLPWLCAQSSWTSNTNRLNSYYSCGSGDSDSLSYGYFLLKNRGLKFGDFNSAINKVYYVNNDNPSSSRNTQNYIFYLDEEHNIQSVSIGTSIEGVVNSLLAKDQTYRQYLSKSNCYILFDLIGAGGGGGGCNSDTGTTQGAGGGGGGAYCRCAVYLDTLSMLVVEIGKGGSRGYGDVSGTHGFESKACVVTGLFGQNDSVVALSAQGVMCDGGHAGYNGIDHNGGNGGAVYRLSYSYVSTDETTPTWQTTALTLENSEGNNNLNLILPSLDTAINSNNYSSHYLGGYAYVVAAITGGWGGTGRRLGGGAYKSAQYGFAALTNNTGSVFSNFNMLCTGGGTVTLQQRAKLSSTSAHPNDTDITFSGQDNGGVLGADGGGGGLCFNPNTVVACYGGGGGYRWAHTGEQLLDGGAGSCGCGGGGGSRVNSYIPGWGGYGGGGAIYVWR